MDDRNGNLVSMAEVLKMPPKEQKHFVEIPDKFLPEIEGMNRHERRKWLRQNRKYLKEASRGEG